jgi:hypothetical protein
MLANSYADQAVQKGAIPMMYCFRAAIHPPCEATCDTGAKLETSRVNGTRYRQSNLRGLFGRHLQEPSKIVLA